MLHSFWTRTVTEIKQIWAPTVQLLTLIGVLGTLFGVVLTMRAVELQRKQYDEESFGRYQNQLMLAWQAIREANNLAHEIGQSSGVMYLAAKSYLERGLVLNRSSLSFIRSSDQDVIYNLDLSSDSFCGTRITHNNFAKIVIFTKSLMKGAIFYGGFAASGFKLADLEKATFWHVYGHDADFLAANLRDTKLWGGSFANAHFQGADLRGLQTLLGYYEVKQPIPEGRFFDYFDYSGQRAVIFDPTITDEDAVSAALGGNSSSFSGAHPVDFEGAVFTGADMRGADLRNSNVTQLQIDQACTDETTRVPLGRVVRDCKGFDWAEGRRQRLAASYSTKQLSWSREKAEEECARIALSR